MARKRRGRGEGSIFKRADGRWSAEVSAGLREDGRRRRRTLYGPTKRDVQRQLHELQSQGFIDATRLTVGQFLDHWLETAVRPSLAPTTHERYKIVVDRYVKPHIGSMRLGKLAPVHVQALYVTQAKAGASLRNQELSGIVLGKALKTAVRLHLIATNPARDVDKPRPQKREMHVWDKGQVDVFLEHARSDRLYALYVLAVTSGMRSGEMFALEWSEVDFENAAVTVKRTLENIGGRLRPKEPKTRQSRRRIDLPQFAVNALHEHRKRMLAEGHAACPVFCDRDGGYLQRQNVKRRSFDRLIAAAGLPPIRFHDLRHTAATLLLLAGENPKVVSERLGHANVHITLDTYSHVLPTMQKGAARKLDKLFG